MTRTYPLLGIAFVLVTASCVTLVGMAGQTSQPNQHPSDEQRSDGTLTATESDRPPRDDTQISIESDRPPNDEPSTAIETEQPSSGGATTVDTSTRADPYPPGVSASGLENATALLNAFVPATTETGYVATTRGNTTIERGGLLVDVTTDGRIAVQANATRYYERRNTSAGPVERSEEMWGNETVEYYQVTEGGTSTQERREPRHQGVLARRPLLEPYLAGSSYVVTDVNETGAPAVVTLNATGVTNETELRKALPGSTEEIREIDATVQVDANGFIRSFEATVQFTIGGANRSQTVVHSLERTGNVTLERPGWVADAENATGGDGVTDADDATDGDGVSDADGAPEADGEGAAEADGEGSTDSDGPLGGDSAADGTDAADGDGAMAEPHGVVPDSQRAAGELTAATGQ